MFENYTYKQIKALSDDQKIEALKELKTIYPDNRELAKHLDTAHIAIANMVGKYLEGKQVGRKKMTEEEKAQAKAERKLAKQQEQIQHSQEKQETENVETEEKNVKTINKAPQSGSNSFSIKLEKNMNGEEIVARLNGIANSILKYKEYKIDLVVEEV